MGVVMYLYKKKYTRNELRQKIGDIYQIGGVKKYKYSDTHPAWNRRHNCTVFVVRRIK